MNNLEKKEKFGYDPERDIEGIYGGIPLAIAGNSKLSPTTRIVSIFIAASINKETGFGHRSNRRLAESAGVSIKSVEKAFSELGKMKYIFSENNKKEQTRYYWWTFQIGGHFKKKK